MEEIVELLGFLGALGNYGYIDRVGNAIDEATLLEALRDAIRAYLTFSECSNKENRCVGIDEKTGILCPDLDPEKLEKSINIVENLVKKSKVNLIRVSREIATRAYASIPRIKANVCTPRGGSQ